jgi:predicted metallopeptidase
MGIKYYEAPDVKQLADAVVRELGFTHIDSENVYCFRSRGSKSRRTIARVHSLGKLWQLAMITQPRYLIEVIAERFDRLSQEDKEKVIIHELMHIPKGFSGGFRPHKGYITQKAVDKLQRSFRLRYRKETLAKNET